METNNKQNAVVMFNAEKALKEAIHVLETTPDVKLKADVGIVIDTLGLAQQYCRMLGNDFNGYFPKFN